MEPYTKECLESYTVAELRKIAKNFHIVGRWEMNKSQLIIEILLIQEEREAEKKQSENEETKETFDNEKVMQDDSNNDHSKYLANIEVGRLVAFNDHNMGIVRTARVVNISQKRQQLKVIDIYGSVEVISFEQVAWVKTGKRWPRRLFHLIRCGQLHQYMLRN
jgi:hypothetical protein|nr:MAG TPA: Rho termination factor, N-terminal domain [Caudoviricetes sp.]